MVAVVIGAGLLALALFAPWSNDEGEVDPVARRHAEEACDLTSKAEEAAVVDSAERYAAAAFLLDTAIIESERAAQGAREFTDLDKAMQAVHTAAHQGSAGPWHDALDDALAACRDALP